MKKIKINGSIFACPKCECKNRWEHSSRPKGWICGNCDYFLSKELLDYLIQNPKLFPSDEEMAFSLGGSAPKPPEYVKGEGQEENVTIVLSLTGTYELPMTVFQLGLHQELTDLVGQFERLDNKLEQYKIEK